MHMHDVGGPVEMQDSALSVVTTSAVPVALPPLRSDLFMATLGAQRQLSTRYYSMTHITLSVAQYCIVLGHIGHLPTTELRHTFAISVRPPCALLALRLSSHLRRGKAQRSTSAQVL
jgi:hypothetical protein